MEFMQIAKSRYATKKFNSQMVPKEKIEQLEEMIRLSASSFGVMPWQVKVIADAATKEKLAPASFNQQQITTCSHLFVFCADTDLEGRAKSLYGAMRTSGVPAENLAGFAKYLDGFITTLPSDQRLSWAQRQLYIAVGNAINGAKALGFDSCPMEGFDPAAYGKILGLPANLTPSALVTVGYAADVARPKVRLEKKDLFF